MRYSKKRKTDIGEKTEILAYEKIAQRLITILLIIMAAISFIPVLLIIIVAFSSETSIAEKGFSFVPSSFSIEALKYILKFGNQIINAYGVTIAETVLGAVITVLFTSMFAFTLSRKEFKLNKYLNVFVIITMLFNGGMLSSYLVFTNVYGLKNNFLVLILPTAVTAYNCIIMRTFIRSNVPDALVEAGRIDGAGEIYIFFHLILPIIKPVLAAIGFMAAVAHWNEWQTAYLYIDNPKLSPLQLVLIRIENNMNYLVQNRSMLSAEEMVELKDLPTESARMMLLFFTIGPIMVAYPFFQKYFVKGITIGAVKG